MKFTSLLISSVILLQACASSGIKVEDKPLLKSVQAEPSKIPSANIDYRGKGSTFLSRVNIGVGIGAGLGGGVGVGAGVSKNLGREPRNEIDAAGMANKIDVDSLMMKKFKTRANDAGVVFVDSAPRLKFTAHSTQLLFEGLMGNPTLTAQADFALKDGDRVVWKYTAQMQGNGKNIPSYSFEELLKKENLEKVLEKAAEILVDEAVKDLNKAATAS